MWMAHADKQAGCGGIFRDASGAWNGEFARNLGARSALSAELWGMLIGVSLAWKKLILESESMVAVTLVQEGVSESHHCGALVRAVREYLARPWEVKVVHTLREGNKVADHLANVAHTLPLGLHVLSSPPDGCGHLLWQDFLGTRFPRRCIV